MCFNPIGGRRNPTPAPDPISVVPPPPPPEAMARSASVAQGAPANPDDIKSASDLRIRRKGRNALRIKLDAGNTGGGTGINVPRS